ncbi:MAG TPA: T9SS type A sorting domain-containing protein [Ignavibacteriales bacterium]|nr:T9SS type A sorting domain-containing protein [Ignavibacteriales bacterium]
MKKLLLLLALLFLTQVAVQAAATLTIIKSGDGTGQVEVNDTLRTLPYTGTFPNNTNVTLKAVPTPGASSFTGWGGFLDGYSSNPITFKLNGEKTVMANFTPFQRKLTITKAGTGTGQVKVNTTIVPLPYYGSFSHGAVVTLEAVPDAGGNTFTGWEGDLSGTTSPTTITMDGDKNVTADFNVMRSITISKLVTGTGSGQVKVNGILYDLPYTSSFANNTVLTMEAVPDAATSSFTAWGGAISGTTNSASITMNGNKSVIIEFTLLQRTLTINATTGTGAGQVKVNETVVTTFPFIQTYPHGTSVNIEAVADGATSSFSSWSGDLAGQPASTSVTMDGDKTTSAAFTLLQRTLSITKTGTGAGQVKVNGTLWDLPYSGSFAQNTVVSLEAAADGATSSFTIWNGDLTGAVNPQTITMNNNKSVSVSFTLLKRDLMVLQSTGTGLGQVKVNDTSRTLPYSASYPHGTIVKLEAVADGSTSSFAGWSGDLTGTTTPATITMDANKSVGAQFTLLQRTLSITNLGTGSGQVKVNGTVYDLPYEQSFAHNTEVNLEAVPDAATSSFASWGGALSGTVNPTSIKMNADQNVTISFTLLNRGLMVLKSIGTGSGEVKVNDTVRTLPYSASFPHGTIVKLEAVPNASTSSFTGWGGDITGTVNPQNLTMNGNKTLYAEFNLLNRSLMVIANTGTGSGQVKVDDTVRTLPYQHYYPHGTFVKLEAAADAATSSFTGWNGALSGTTNPAILTMDADKSVGAVFDLLQRTLFITKLGTGSGQVKVNGTVHDLPYSGDFPHNTVVNLEAVPDAATSSFASWGGDLTGSVSLTTITMNGSKSVTAAFALLGRQLMVLENTGTGLGQVKVNDTLRTLPYSASYPHGTTVKLEAVADAATSIFTGWGGDLSGMTNPVNITMTSNITVSAEFTLLKRSLMVLQYTGTGTGQVKVNDTIRTLPYSASYPHGTIVKLEAAADASTSSFTGWKGDLTGTTNPANITMNSDKSLNAEFKLLKRSLMVLQSTGTGSGTVKVNDTLRTLPYSASYPHGTVVKMEAVADANSIFTGWNGIAAAAAAVTANPVNITMDQDKGISAELTLNRFTLKINSAGKGLGLIMVNGEVVKLPFERIFISGTDVTVKAIPYEGSIFNGWSGSLTEKDNPLEIKVNSDTTLTAAFCIILHKLTITPKGTGTGQVKVNDELKTLPYEGQFEYDEVVKLQAVPCEGNSFVAWGGDLTGTCSNPASIKMTSDRKVTVEFNSVPCPPVLVSPAGQCDLVGINPLFKWQASQNATEYNIQVSTDICFKNIVADEKVTCTNKQIGPLNYNTCYYWRVRAGNCAGMGKFSDAAVFKTEKQPVKAPCNLVARAEVGKVRLIWSDSSDNESGFMVFRKEGDVKSANIYDFMGKVDRNNTAFVDSTIKVNVTYTYKVSAYSADSVVSYSNEFTITNTFTAVEANIQIPSDYKLYQNYPNPFNPSTVIRYYLKSDCHVKLTVFNSLGKEVSVLVNEFRQSGMNTVTFSARDISAGVYLYRIETLEEGGKRYMDVKKLVLMK